jgi:hypothetical protein
MIRLGILVAEVRGVLDANTVLRRADLDPDPVTTGGKPPAADSPAQPAIAAIASDGRGGGGALERIDVTPFSASIIVGSGGERRQFVRMGELHRPGIYGLMNADAVYIGMGSDVGLRVSTGNQPMAPPLGLSLYIGIDRRCRTPGRGVVETKAHGRRISQSPFQRQHPVRRHSSALPIGCDQGMPRVMPVRQSVIRALRDDLGVSNFACMFDGEATPPQVDHRSKFDFSHFRLSARSERHCHLHP